MRPVMMLLTLSCMAMFPVESGAEIVSGSSLRVDFTDVEDARSKAEWSDPERLTVTVEGLGWDGSPSALREGWFQTKPVPTGLSWRPAVSVSIRAAVHPRPEPFKLSHGMPSTPNPGALYVRYSPDALHWSSWQALTPAEPQSAAERESSGRLFNGTVRVPNLERAEYAALLDEYAKLDVPWKSDQEAAVRWMLEKRPGLFAECLPFVGYVQFLFEGDFHGGQRLTSFAAFIGYSLSGLHYAPDDKEAYRVRGEQSWSFRADED